MAKDIGSRTELSNKAEWQSSKNEFFSFTCNIYHAILSPCDFSEPILENFIDSVLSLLVCF